MRLEEAYKYDHKDQSPIRFEFFQSDMEKMLFFLGEAIKLSAYHDSETKNYQDNGLTRNLSNIKQDIEWKVTKHRERGEWK